jgi:xanthine dehydrogenase accessory factor
MLGYRVTVVDPRPVFATGERFPAANEVVVAWPGEYLATQVLEPDAAVCVLTHDTRMDVPALVAALSSPARYVGAMGSRRTHEQRLQRLREQGVPEQDLARLHSPIGLDLGGSTPAQTAIAIVAEIIADREGGTGVPLSETAGPVHRAVARRSGT